MKPSDTPQARRERQQRKRSLDRIERHGDAANALAADLREAMSYFWDRAIAGDLPFIPGKSPIARFHDLLQDVRLQDERRRNLEIWEMFTGEWVESFSKGQRLALQAGIADRNRVGEERRQRASIANTGWKNGVWTGARAGEPWFKRLQDQIQEENAYSRRGGFSGDICDHFETLVLLWAFGRVVARYGRRRKLRLKDGKTQTFIVAERAGNREDLNSWLGYHWYWDYRLTLPPRQYSAAATPSPPPGQALALENSRLQRRLPGDWQRKHWDSIGLHFGFLDKNFALIRDPVLPSEESIRFWISAKATEAEFRRLWAWKERRWSRLPKVIRELKAIARSEGRTYVPPPRKTIICLEGRHKSRRLDPWQVAAEKQRKLVNGWANGRWFVGGAGWGPRIMGGDPFAVLAREKGAAWHAQKVREHVALYRQAEKLGL